MTVILFPDKAVTYDTFMNDLASRIVRALKCQEADPKFISQRKAYEIFGRSNVDRWRRQGKIKAFKRPGKVEYCTAELRYLQSTEQDYFKP